MSTDLQGRIEVSLGNVHRPDDTNEELERLARIYLTSFFRERGVDASAVKVKVKILAPGRVGVTLRLPKGFE